MSIRVLYLAHGKAGYRCLNLMVNQLGIKVNNILCFSYQMEENIPLVQRLAVLGIKYSLKKIRESESMSLIEKFRPDIVVSIHFRDIIPDSIIKNCRYGGFNLHPSLLPKYRGCFSGPWALINLESETGISYHLLSSGIDEGKLILQKKIPIEPKETGYSIFNKLVDLGIDNFCDAFSLITTPGFLGQDQVGLASYFSRKIPHNGIIDPNWEIERIDAFIRALYFPKYRGAQVYTSDGIKEVLDFEAYRELLNKGCVIK